LKDSEGHSEAYKSESEPCARLNLEDEAILTRSAGFLPVLSSIADPDDELPDNILGAQG
jgi:hypothetical protein